MQRQILVYLYRRPAVIPFNQGVNAAEKN